MLRPVRSAPAAALVVALGVLLAGCTSSTPDVSFTAPSPTAPSSTTTTAAASSTAAASVVVLAQDTSLTAPGGTAAPIIVGTVTADRKDFGYVAALLSGPNGMVLRFDRAQDVSNQELAAAGEPTVPNNSEVVDDNPQLRDYPVAASVVIMLNGTTSTLHTASIDDLVALLTQSTGPVGVLVDLTYDAQGTVTEIDQHYRP